MFYKKVNYNSNKECFEFLTNHFEYNTLNSWNGLRSIANNVKVYKLPDVDDSEALEALEEDDYTTINMCIRDWEDEHPGYKVGFNGRSGGYLVLYNDRNNDHCFDDDYDSPCKFRKEDYNDWVKCVQDDYGSLKNYHYQLVEQVKLVQEFDKLCDNLVDVLKELIKEMKQRRQRTYEWHAMKRHEQYTYETLKDLKLHKEYMLQCGYTIFDESDTDLYAEYEKTIECEGTVEVDDDYED